MRHRGIVSPIRRTVFSFLFCSVLAMLNQHSQAETNQITLTAFSAPLSLERAFNLALQQNRAILKSRAEVESQHGVVIQTRAVVIPKVQATGNYTDYDPKSIESFPVPGVGTPHQSWNTGLQLVQSFYEGGRMSSALRTAKLTREQSLLRHQTVLADTLLAVRVAYYDVLVAAQQIIVREASVNLLGKEQDDQQRRLDAGTVPRFNVLRAEVAVANAKPALIRARNAHRVAKNNLANLLGFDLPREVGEDIPLQLTDTLELPPVQFELSAAIGQALANRTEIAALRKAELLRKEDIVNARSGMLPSVQGFAGWGWRNSSFTTDLAREVDGWQVGAQMSWNIFDGDLTRGKIVQAKAQQEKARIELDDSASKIELEVRTAYSEFVGAREVLESQKKVQEQADEALRLAKARADAGTATQLDVLNAETALTEARTTQVQAQRDYAVAVSKLERSIGKP